MSSPQRSPATACEACGEEYTAGEDIGRFDPTIARTLLDAGEASGEAFKFARKAMGIRAADLAQILGVTPETVSRWETGVHPIDPMALAVLALFARDAVAGLTTMLDALKARAAPKPLAKRVTRKLASRAARRPLRIARSVLRILATKTAGFALTEARSGPNPPA